MRLVYCCKMQLHSETLRTIQNTTCMKHPFCMKFDRDWSASLKKIMFNDIFGINNLRSHKSPLLRCSWTSLWIVVSICILLLASDVDARPTAAISSNVRDNSRYFRVSSYSSTTSGSPKLFNINPSSSSDTLSLSIFSPLDILRQNMLLEIQRKRLRHAKQRQVQVNKEFLDRIGR